MTTQIERPIFFEGQLLGADDLGRAVDYVRDQNARHERYMHLWGIAVGLDLKGEKEETATGAEYLSITLSKGTAIDGFGREIVVPEDERLDEDLFKQMNVATNDDEAYYPVFLAGRDEPTEQQPLSAGACNQSQPTRTAEGFQLTFGRPGDALDLDKQDAPDIADGPGTGGWRILLGFVQWEKNINKFKSVANESDGIGRRYAGVQADVVAARDGRLTLRTRPAIVSGKPAVVIDEFTGNLEYGALTDQGVITPVFTVTGKGDVEAKGSFKGAVTPGSVQIQSGIATDGVVLPLPPGITEDQVAAGQVKLHIQVTPLLPEASDLNSMDVPYECEVEATTRRVRCRFKRVKIGAPPAVLLPGPCNYLVLASVAAAQGGSS